MAQTEEKIVKIVDESTHTRGASVEQVGSQGALIVKAVGQEGDLPTSGNNPTITITYTGGIMTKLTKVIGTTSYEKSFTWTNGVLTNISAWSEV